MRSHFLIGFGQLDPVKAFLSKIPAVWCTACGDPDGNLESGVRKKRL